MIEQNVQVGNDLGLHLRAAGTLVQLASKFESEVWVTKGEMRVNAKSIMSVLSLAAARGTVLNISADGPDCQDAVASVAQLIENGFEG